MADQRGNEANLDEDVESEGVRSFNPDQRTDRPEAIHDALPIRAVPPVQRAPTPPLAIEDEERIEEGPDEQADMQWFQNTIKEYKKIFAAVIIEIVGTVQNILLINGVIRGAALKLIDMATLLILTLSVFMYIALIFWPGLAVARKMRMTPTKRYVYIICIGSSMFLNVIGNLMVSNIMRSQAELIEKLRSEHRNLIAPTNQQQTQIPRKNDDGNMLVDDEFEFRKRLENRTTASNYRSTPKIERISIESERITQLEAENRRLLLIVDNRQREIDYIRNFLDKFERLNRKQVEINQR